MSRAPVPFPHYGAEDSGYAVLLMDPRSGVIDTDSPVPYSVVVFRDPDNIQLELIYMAA